MEHGSSNIFIMLPIHYGSQIVLLQFPVGTHNYNPYGQTLIQWKQSNWTIFRGCKSIVDSVHHVFSSVCGSWSMVLEFNFQFFSFCQYLISFTSYSKCKNVWLISFNFLNKHSLTSGFSDRLEFNLVSPTDNDLLLWLHLRRQSTKLNSLD